MPTHLTWTDAWNLGLRGQGRPLEVMNAPYHRLPAKAEQMVPEQVWRLSHQPAGVYLYFHTVATQLAVRYTCTIAVPMGYADFSVLLTGGIDCYGRCPERGWLWVGACVPNTEDDITYDGIGNLSPLYGVSRVYRMYPGMCTGLQSWSIGVNPGATVTATTASRATCMQVEDASRTIAYYDTSIVHGWAALRPGCVHAHVMARNLRCPIIGFGCSGNARMELALADLLGELDPAVYIV